MDLKPLTENIRLFQFNDFVSSRVEQLTHEVLGANYHECRLIATGEWNILNGNKVKFDQLYTMECFNVYKGQDIHITINNLGLENAQACRNTVKRWKLKEIEILKERIHLLVNFEDLLYQLLNSS
jgi:hypothetical protein